MKADNPLKHFALAFVIALVGYVLVFYWIQHRRTRKGPWQVEFSDGQPGVHSLIVNQPTLSISNVRLIFATSTNSPVPAARATSLTNSTLFFREPRAVPFPLPFGQCIFMDTTFLPGTITMQCGGHEIELLPRVLIIDRQPHPWKSGEEINLQVK